MIGLVAFAAASEEFEGVRFYFGDVHSHTGASGDGGSSDIGTCVTQVEGSEGRPATCGAYKQIDETARANGLDFLATVDHVTTTTATTTPESFAEVFRAVNAMDDATNGFVTLPGAEIFVEKRGADGSRNDDLGHRSLLFFGDALTLAEVTMADLQPSRSLENVVADCSVLTSFMDDLTARFGRALLIPHHPGVKKPMPTDWDCLAGEYEPVVEAYSEHGSSLDATSSFDVPWGTYHAPGTVRNALDPETFGHRVGIVAGSDNHDTHPGQVCGTDTVLDNHPYGAGLTGIFLDGAEAYDRSALYDALLARHAFATTGPMLPVIVEVRLADGTILGGMGDEITLDTRTDVIVEARVPEDAEGAVVDVVAFGQDPAEWRLSRAGTGTYRATIGASELPDNLFVDVRLDGALIYASGCTDGGDDATDHLWTSPVWFVLPEADEDGDGWVPSAGDCDDANGLAYPGAPENCGNPAGDYDCDGIAASSDDDCDTDTGTIDTATTDTGALPDDTADPSLEGGTHMPGSRCACGGGAVPGLGVLLTAMTLARRRR